MASPIMLRDDFDAQRLRGLAKVSRDPDQLRRLLSLTEIYDGGSRGDAARIGDVGLQTIRDWVVRFEPQTFNPQRLQQPNQKLDAQRGVKG